MRVYFETPQRLKIELDQNDMRELDVTYDELDYNDDKTRRIMNELLYRIGMDSDFSSSNGKLIIEVFPTDKGGCIIYFTSVRNQPVALKKKLKSTVTVWQFDDANDLYCAAKRLYFLNINNKASLYLLSGKYRLAVDDISNSEELILSEFSQKLKNSSAYAYTREHGQLLTADAINDLN